jgi:hypothetical protein
MKHRDMFNYYESVKFCKDWSKNVLSRKAFVFALLLYIFTYKKDFNRIIFFEKSMEQGFTFALTMIKT